MNVVEIFHDALLIVVVSFAIAIYALFLIFGFIERKVLGRNLKGSDRTVKNESDNVRRSFLKEKFPNATVSVPSLKNKH